MDLCNFNNQLSKGCQLCQQGKWLCIFITYQCNSICHFCPSPFKDDRIHSAFGNKKEEILPYLFENDFEGISFSGGDPFLVFDRLKSWLVYFKKHLPHYYYWVYTNGLNADSQKMKQLASAGMNEIRFNIAATGYLSEIVLKNIKDARDLFPYVAVEIPSIRKDFPLLEAALETLEKIGVDYLNLHDYILSESDSVSSEESSENFVLNKNIHLKYALSSIENTKATKNQTLEKGYRFHINHCSMQQKELQMKWRRIKMGKIFNNQDYDIMLEDGIICNYYKIPSEKCTDDLEKRIRNPEFRKGLESYLIKSAELANIKSSGCRIIKVSFIPQMEIGQEKMFLRADLF